MFPRCSGVLLCDAFVVHNKIYLHLNFYAHFSLPRAASHSAFGLSVVLLSYYLRGDIKKHWQNVTKVRNAKSARKRVHSVCGAQNTCNFNVRRILFSFFVQCLRRRRGFYCICLKMGLEMNGNGRHCCAKLQHRALYLTMGVSPPSSLSCSCEGFVSLAIIFILKMIFFAECEFHMLCIRHSIVSLGQRLRNAGISERNRNFQF